MSSKYIGFGWWMSNTPKGTKSKCHAVDCLSPLPPFFKVLLLWSLELVQNSFNCPRLCDGRLDLGCASWRLGWPQFLFLGLESQETLSSGSIRITHDPVTHFLGSCSTDWVCKHVKPQKNWTKVTPTKTRSMVGKDAAALLVERSGGSKWQLWLCSWETKGWLARW